MGTWKSGLILAGIVLLLTLTRLSLWSLDRPIDADELVYVTLARRLGEQPRRYDLLGTHVLQYLSPTVYERPLFFHPPLFAGAVHLGGETLLIPWLSNALTLWLVWWLGQRWFDKRRAWLAVALYACCPVAYLCGCRLWIDGFLTLWMTAAVAATVWCLEQPSDAWFALPGLCIGLAALSKMPGLLALVPVAALWRRSGRTFRPVQAVWLGFPILALVGPWLLQVWSVYHSLALSESRIPDGELDRFPFIALARQRPFWFYVGGLLLVAPVHVFSLWGTIRSRLEIAVWPWTVVLAMTIFGVSNTFQLRYIAPAMPGLCVLAADQLCRLPRRIWWLMAPLLLYGLACGVNVGIVHREIGDLVPIVGPALPRLFGNPFQGGI